MKKIIALIFMLLTASSSALCQPWIVGSWHAETGSEYDVRLTFKEAGNGLMEYWDLDHETLKSHCESWKFQWRYSANSIVLKGLPWKCTLKLNENSNSLEPDASGNRCNSYLLNNPFVKSSITDDRRIYVERWQLHKCKK
jgi:hypothetical protein